MIQIHKQSISFLTQLAQNNNRDWFNEHKATYLVAQNNIIDFIDALIIEMNKQSRKVLSSANAQVLARVHLRRRLHMNIT